MSIKVLVVLSLIAAAASSPTPDILPIDLPGISIGGGVGLQIGSLDLGKGLRSLFGGLPGQNNTARNDLSSILSLKVSSFIDVCNLFVKVVVALCDTIEASITGFGTLLARVMISHLKIIICILGGAGSSNPICGTDVNLLVGVQASAATSVSAVINLFGVSDCKARLNTIISIYTKGRGISVCRGSVLTIFNVALNLINRLQVVIDGSGSLGKADFGLIYRGITSILGAIGNSRQNGLGLTVATDFVNVCNKFIVGVGYPDFGAWTNIQIGINAGNDDNAPWAISDVDASGSTGVSLSIGGLIGKLFKGLIGVTRLESNLIQDIQKIVIKSVEDVFTLGLKIVLGLGGLLDATIAGLGSLLVRIIAGLLKIILCFVGAGKYGVCSSSWDRQIGVTGSVTSIEVLIQLYGIGNCRAEVDEYIRVYTNGTGIDSTSGSVKILLQSCITLADIVQTKKWTSNIVVLVYTHITYLIGAVGNSNAKGVGTAVCNKFIPACNKYLTDAGYPGFGNDLEGIIRIVEQASNDKYTWTADIDTSDGKTGFIIGGSVGISVGGGTGLIGGLIKGVFGTIAGVSNLAINALNEVLKIRILYAPMNVNKLPPVRKNKPLPREEPAQKTRRAIGGLNDVFSLFINLSLVLQVTLNNLVFGLGSLFVRLIAVIIKISVCILGFPGDQGICVTGWNAKFGINKEASNAADLIVIFGLGNAEVELNGYINTITKGKGISVLSGSTRTILEKITTLVTFTKNYNQISKQTVTDTFIIMITVSGCIGNSRKTNSGKEIVEKIVPECGKYFKQQGYLDITVNVTTIINECSSSNGDNVNWDGSGIGNSSNNGNTGGSTGGDNGNTGGDNGNTGGDNGNTSGNTGGDNGNTGGNTGGDNGNTGGNTGGDNGNTGGDTGGDNGNTGGDTGGDNGNTGGNTGGDNGNTGGNTGGDNGNTGGDTGDDNGNTSGNTGGDIGNTGGNNGGDNGNTGGNTGGDNGNTGSNIGNTGGNIGNGNDFGLTIGGIIKVIPGVTSISAGIIGDLTKIKINTFVDIINLITKLSIALGGIIDSIISGLGSIFIRIVAVIFKIGYCVNGWGSDKSICTKEWNAQFGVTGEASTIIDLIALFRLNNCKSDVAAIVSTYTNNKGISSTSGFVYVILQQVTSLSLIVSSGTITKDNFSTAFIDVLSIFGSISNSYSQGSGTAIIQKIIPACGPIFVKQGFADISVQLQTIVSTANFGNNDKFNWSVVNSGNDFGLTIGGTIKLIPGVTSISSGIIGDLTKIKINTFVDIINLITKLAIALGGIIDSIISGLGSIFIRIVAVIFKIGYCVNGWGSDKSICTKEWNAQFGVTGEASTIIDLIALFRLNNCKSDVAAIVSTYTNNKGISSTSGFVYVILQQVTSLSVIVSSGTITKDNFSTAFIYVISIFGSISNSYSQGSGTAIIEKIIPACGPIFVQQGFADISVQLQTVVSTANFGNNDKFNWSVVNSGNDFGLTIGGTIKLIPGVTSISSGIIGDLTKIKINTFVDIINLITKLAIALGGIIDSIISGLGSIFIRIVAVIFKIGYCVNGWGSDKSICTKEWNAQFGVTGEASTIIDLIALFRLNNCKSDVAAIVSTYTNNKGISSTSGFIYVILQQITSLSVIVSSGTITKDNFSIAFIYVISIFGSITNSYSQGSGTAVIEKIIPACGPIFVQQGFADISVQLQTVVSTANFGNNDKFNWSIVKNGGDSYSDKLTSNVKQVFKDVNTTNDVDTTSLTAVLNLQAPRNFDDVCSFGVQVVLSLGGILDVYISGLGTLIARLVGALINYIVAILGAARNSKSFVSQNAYYASFGVSVSVKTWAGISAGFKITNAKADLDGILSVYTKNKGLKSLAGAKLVFFNCAYSLVDIVLKGKAIVEADLTIVFQVVTTLISGFANSISVNFGKTICDNMLPTVSYWLEKNGYPSLASQSSTIYSTIETCNNSDAPWAKGSTATIVNN